MDTNDTLIVLGRGRFWFAFLEFVQQFVLELSRWLDWFLRPPLDWIKTEFDIILSDDDQCLIGHGWSGWCVVYSVGDMVSWIIWFLLTEAEAPDNWVKDAPLSPSEGIFGSSPNREINVHLGMDRNIWQNQKVAHHLTLPLAFYYTSVGGN